MAPVLSIGKVTAANAGYWEDAVAKGREDYYSGAGEAPGQWVGRADLLSRDAGTTATAVDSALLLSALSAPDGTVLGRKVTDRVKTAADGTKQSLKAVNAHDLTFSAPKGVSTLWAVGDPDLQAAVEDSHNEAIAVTLGWIDRHVIFTRSGAGGVNVEDTDGLVGIQYQHRTSRSLDPQLHGHVIVANIARTSVDGVWRRLDGRAIFASAKPAGMIYQAALRAGMSARTGVEFGKVDENGQADVLGVDAGLIKMFSKRAAVIDARLDAWTEDFTARNARPPTPTERRTAAETIVLATRPPKPKGAYATSSLHGRWRTEAQAAGFDVDAMIADVCGRTTRPTVSVPSGDAAVAEVSRLNASWTPAKLAGVVARGTFASSAAEVVEVVETITAAALESAAVVELTATADDDDDGVRRRRDGRRVDEAPTAVKYASTQHLQREHIVMGWGQIEASKYEDRPVDVEGLDAGQAAAATRIVNEHRPLHVVIGPAGAGKTTMLTRAVDAWRTDGVAVFGVAPASTAAAQLGKGAGVEHDTLAKFIKDHCGKTPAKTMPAGSVVICDEAAMASTNDLYELAIISRRHSLRVVLVGDHKQLAAVEPGGMFEALAATDTVAVSELDQIHRFNNTWEADASKRLRAGDGDVVDVYNDQGRIDVHAGRDSTLDALADAATADLLAGIDTLTMAHANRDVVDLNDRITSRLIDAGQLPAQPMVTIAGKDWRLGEHVVTRRNDRQLTATGGDWVRNGDRWRIDMAYGPKALGLVNLDDGRTQRVDADYIAINVERGYAITVHRAQGATVDRGQLYTTPNMPAAALYVGLTRGRQDNRAHLHADHDPIDDHQAEADLNRTAFDPLNTMRTTISRIDDHAAAISVQRQHAHNIRVTKQPIATREQRAARNWWGINAATLPALAQAKLAGHTDTIVDTLATDGAPTHSVVRARVRTAAEQIDWRVFDAANVFVQRLTDPANTAVPLQGNSDAANAAHHGLAPSHER